MRIYIDGDYKCRVTNDGGMRGFELDFFDGKCRGFTEGYRYIPAGESWMRADGEVFAGEMLAPWKDYELLCQLQEQYELLQGQIEDMAAALELIYSGEVAE